MEAETAQTVETEGATPVAPAPAPAPAAENFVPSTEPERSGAPSAQDDGYDKTQELFVSGLSWYTHELDLARHIEKVAAVKRVNIPYKDNHPRGFAFVRLEDPSLIDQVAEELNGKELNGRVLRVIRSQPNPKPRRAPQQQHRQAPAAPAAAAAAAAAPLPPPQAPMAEDAPRYVQYQRQMYRPQHPQQWRGGWYQRPRYQQPYYPQRQYQMRQYQPMARPPMRVEPMRHLSTQPPPVDFSRRPALNPVRIKSELTVVVQNLPYVAAEEDMFDVFEGFTVKNVRISRTATGRSRGIAFVTFSSHEEQQRAIRETDKTVVEQRDIHVAEAFLLPREIEKEKADAERA